MWLKHHDNFDVILVPSPNQAADHDVTLGL